MIKVKTAGVTNATETIIGGNRGKIARKPWPGNEAGPRCAVRNKLPRAFGRGKTTLPAASRERVESPRRNLEGRIVMDESEPWQNNESYDRWLETLREDVIEGEYGYEPGEFGVFAEAWWPLYEKGMTPQQAFRRALDAHREQNTA